MRSYIVQILSTDATLAALGLPANAVYSADNIDTPPEKPFIAVKHLESLSALKGVPSQPQPFELWVYDVRGDYSRIDAILKRCRDLLENVRAQQTNTGWITQVDWLSNGRDGYDDVWEAIYRIGSYKAISSYT